MAEMGLNDKTPNFLFDHPSQLVEFVARGWKDERIGGGYTFCFIFEIESDRTFKDYDGSEFFFRETKYGVFWNSDNRYIWVFLPAGARLLTEGKRTEHYDPFRYSYEWKERHNPFDENDRNIAYEVLGKEAGEAWMKVLLSMTYE